MKDPDFFEIPIDGVLDLHTFRPAECADLVLEYLNECRARNILQARIVHGKGRGVLRDIVWNILEQNPAVVRYGQAPDEAGGWGATVVELTALCNRDIVAN